MTATLKRQITRADILPIADYARERKALREGIVALKKRRRVEVGPVATFHFENYQTMWHQVHEMLFIEKGGEPQIADELAAFNPLIPQGGELVATLMLEIPDPVVRAHTLARLGHIERHIFFEVAGARVAAVAETDVERTKDDGKTSSVHFLRFPFAAEQIAAFRTEGARIVLGLDHPEYGHMAILPGPVRAALAADFA
ncbi:MAG: DUF3501 family protein [Proteobacteria bacterium]|nr:DUF3501 family protein [Pseudomonadota bacterium]